MSTAIETEGPKLKLDGDRWKAPLKPGELDWTEERVETLKRMWADGASQNDIAVELGLNSRGAVSGKIARLGLSGRPAGRNRAPKHVAARSIQPVEMPVGRLTIEELTDYVCHFPVGEGPFLFCGGPTDVEPYCMRCTAIAYRGPETFRDRKVFAMPF